MVHSHLDGSNQVVRLIVASQIVFENPKYKTGFVAIALFFFALLIAIPASTVPGNDFFFQLSILTKTDFLLLLTLSVLTGLAATFHIYLIKNQNKVKLQSLAGQTGTSLLSGLIASVFATASCSACVASIFGFLGFTAVLFLLKFRLYIVSLAILLNIVSLYHLSKKVLGVCQTCKISLK
ncbi:hypothetical protein HYU92_06265 [Candidatus Curtissbacteria bacterium]|nr:hypothetical protein [Candidatus Curtissbacteria bacterium]